MNSASCQCGLNSQDIDHVLWNCPISEKFYKKGKINRNTPVANLVRNSTSPECKHFYDFPKWRTHGRDSVASLLTNATHCLSQLQKGHNNSGERTYESVPAGCYCDSRMDSVTAIYNRCPVSPALESY